MKECPYCTKIFQSYKSWHRHKTLSHPDQIKQPGWQSRQYQLAPHPCKSCSNTLTFEQYHHGGQYCSSSCSASATNKIREADPEYKQQIQNTWRNKLGVLNRDKTKEQKIRKTTEYKIEMVCPTCSISFLKRSSKQKYCHPTCNPTKTAKIQYRTRCKFKLNPKDHADLYNFELIKSNGWYSASNSKAGYNPDGVTWDHLYRIEDGFKNHVHPEIMSHPANAEMITWRENQKRKSSQITLDELKLRIGGVTQN
jgi:hypothetical protein